MAASFPGQGDQEEGEARASLGEQGEAGGAHHLPDLGSALYLLPGQSGEGKVVIGETEPSAGAEDPGNLPNAFCLVSPMVEGETAHDEIDASIVEGKGLSLSQLEGCLRIGNRGFREHVLGGIDAEKPGVRPENGCGPKQATRAAADVDDAGGRRALPV